MPLFDLQLIRKQERPAAESAPLPSEYKDREGVFICEWGGEVTYGAVIKDGEIVGYHCCRCERVVKSTIGGECRQCRDPETEELKRESRRERSEISRVGNSEYE